jgi:hypothetical protein
VQETQLAVGITGYKVKAAFLFCRLHFVLQHDGNTRQTKKKKKRLQLCSTQLQVPKSSLSRLADFFHQQLPGYGLLSADNKMQSVKIANF